MAQTRTRRNDTESDTDNASDRESSDSSSESSDGGARARHTTLPAAGNIRRGRGQIRGRGRGCNGDSLGPTACGSGSATPTVPTLADGTEIEWQADSGECGANWMRQLPNDLPLGKPAFFPTMNLRPIDFFMRTFPLALLTLLCTETNRYFADSSRQPSMNDAIRKAWVDVDVPEMKAFISVLIVMGLCRRFSYRSARTGVRTGFLTCQASAQSCRVTDSSPFFASFIFRTILLLYREDSWVMIAPSKFVQ